VPRISTVNGNDYFEIFGEDDSATSPSARIFDESYTSIDRKLNFMADNNIDITIVSVGNPWLDPFDGDDSPDIASLVNEELASYEKLTDGKIRSMGVLPANNIQSAIKTLDEISDMPGLYGVTVSSRICGRAFDDPELEDFWAALSAKQLPLFMHPHYGCAMDALGGFGHALPVALGFTFESSIAISRLIFAGMLHRLPDLKILVAHGGGTLPFLAGRLDAAWRSDPSLHERLPEPPSESIARLYGDLVLYRAEAIVAARGVLGGPEKMVYGTDHPFSVSDPDTNIAQLGLAMDSGSAQLALANAASLFGLEV